MARKNNNAEAAPVAEIEAVGKPGMGIDEGIVLTTFFLLGIAVWMVLMVNSQYAPAAG
ncbi:MAG: hypothetical protein H6835_18825 [Planctomycetes bacterium]|nr:hypothetical protein [Planctomycetota bacterium]